MKKQVELHEVLVKIEKEIRNEKEEKLNNLIDEYAINLYNLQEEKGQLSLQDMIIHLRMFSIGMKKI